MSQAYDTLIIGAGLSGLTVAHTIRTLQPDNRLLVLEQSERTGGVIDTVTTGGFICERGPHGFLDNCQESQDLLAELNLLKERVTAPLSQHVRYVYLNGKLNCIPQTPPKLLMAPLISWPAKLRVAAEIFQKPLIGEPTVDEWVAHRLGRAMLPFADAVFTGTYAGDTAKLAIDAVMPGARALEKEHGSLIRGLFARRKTQGSQPRKGMPAMISFPQGMQRLPERLAENLQPGENLLLNCPVKAIQRSENIWRVISEQGAFAANRLVIALPVNPSLKLLATFTDNLPIHSIAEAWVTNIVAGFKAPASLPPGFGFLAPEQEKQFILGSLFSSNMFAGRAPETMILCETLVGGRRHPERRDLANDRLLEQSLANLQKILAIHGQPAFTDILQPLGGIPQLEKGYIQLLNWRNRLMQDASGLHICGFGWEGIGINDMITTARKTAKTVCANSSSRSHQHEIKKIYF